jgi:PAS domain S-box-containing protein
MVQGVVRLEPFLNAIFANRGSETNHSVLIEDRGASTSDRSIGIIDQSGAVTQASSASRQRFTEPEVLHREITLWGRTLAFAFRQQPVTAIERAFNRPGDLVSGLLVSSAFGLLAFSLARRNTLVESEVQLRTQELESSQLELERDIAQRIEAENRLRTSEQRYRSLFDQHPDAVYSADLNGHFQSANQGMERLTGYSVEEIVQLSCEAVTAPETLEFCKAHFNRAASGHSVNFDLVGICKTGERFHANVTQLPIVVDGKIVGVYGIAKDITEVTRITRELANFFDLSAEMMAISGVDGYCRRVNRAFEKVTGFSADEFITRPYIDFVHPEDHEVTRTQLAKLSPELTTVNLENRIRTKGGDYRLLAWSVRLVPEDGIIHAVAHDITDQRRQEMRIREQASLLDKAQDAIVVYGLDFRISFWNKSAERLYGWSSSEAMRRDIRDLIYRDHREVFEAAHAALIETGERTGELRQTSRDGRAILGEARWTIVRTNSGGSYSVLSIITDITEQKKVEAQFLRIQRVESLGTLASGIAHDLNNVLAPILMATGLLKHANQDENELRILNSMEISARRGSDLVKQILAFARGDEGQQIPTSPAHLFQEMHTVISETFPKSLHCEIRCPNDVWPIVGDPTQLHQVLLNLCLNARDAMPRGGTLSLTAENVVLEENQVKFPGGGAVGPHVLLTISDTGTGIPAEIREKVFDPFFTTKEVGKGTGLGLSTVLTIVRTNRGFLQLISEEGKGTTFRIYFPAEKQTSLLSGTAEVFDYPRGAGEVILVVDDEDSVRTVTRRTLEAFGYRTVVANNGADALVKYVEQQHEIAAVITDMMMPVMDGPALIRALTNLNPEIRVIAASGLHGVGSEASAAESGVKDFLPKPYTTEVMLETIARVLKMS